MIYFSELNLSELFLRHSARKQKVEPPSFLKKIGDIEVFRGMSAKFTACATGTPEPDVEWYDSLIILVHSTPVQTRAISRPTLSFQFLF